ncbi:MAG: dihydropteroate synthase [Muribaculaceae bacterium]|nr:dihydropteroate synthase [Muribaculaceae bacterium]
MDRYFSLNIKGELKEFFEPVVMGIINVTPDSFYCNSRNGSVEEVVATAGRMLQEGASMLDIGGCSTRPGSEPATEYEELERVVPAVAAVRSRFPEAIISVDTFRGKVARQAVEAGADIINDVSAGNIDGDILQAAADLKVPYVLMHPAESSLQPSTPMEETTPTVLADMQRVLRDLRLRGVCDVIVDPGFGFGKTLEQNYRLMAELEAFEALGCPLLVGISRKSMVNRLLDVQPASIDSLLGTDVLNGFALCHGAHILRVHDVKAAADAVKIINRLTL